MARRSRPVVEPSARYAFATSEDAATVTAIHLDTFGVAAMLPAGPQAHAMALSPDGALLYVVNRRGGSLTVVDCRSLCVLGTIPLSSDPMAAAISPDGRCLAVLGRTRLVAWILDAATGELRHEVSLDREPVSAWRDDGPCCTHPIWLPDSTGFYAEDNVHTRFVHVDAVRGDVVGAATLSSPAHTGYVDAVGERLFALCSGGATGEAPALMVIDVASGTVLAEETVALAAGESGELHHAAHDEERGLIFVANMGRGRPRGGHSIHVFDVDTLRFVARLQARAGAGHPLQSPDNARLFVVNHSDPTISVFDVDRLCLTAEVVLPGAGNMGHGCFFSGDGRYFWCLSSQAGAAYVIDTAALAVVARIDVGPNSQDIVHRWRDAYA